jgi:hypothetical protein
MIGAMPKVKTAGLNAGDAESPTQRYKTAKAPRNKGQHRLREPARRMSLV